MARSDYPLIAREGRPYLLVTAAFLVAAVSLGWVWLLLPAALLFVLLILLFRDPRRPVPAVPLGVVSPVDGVVVSIADTPKGILDRKAKRIIIRVSSLGAYTARSPIGGRVMDLQDQGQLGVRLRGQGGLWVRNEAGDDVVLVLQGSSIIGKPKALIGYGERIGHGQRAAYLRLPDYAQVYLPATVKLHVEEGQSVLAGSQLLAEMVRRPTENSAD